MRTILPLRETPGRFGRDDPCMRTIILNTALLAALPMPAPAFAAGGAHFIDDAAVETPGTCHLESWVSSSLGGVGLVNSAPACTRSQWPNLELGGFVAHAWAPGADDSLIGLSPKLMLRSEDRGVGVGVATSVGYGIQRGRLETASVAVPVTIPAGEWLRLNFNIGWLWTRIDAQHTGYIGGQAEIALRTKLNLMVETFARDKGKVGGQLGLRWTLPGGDVDLDLIGGRYVDGVTQASITFGLTIRQPIPRRS